MYSIPALIHLKRGAELLMLIFEHPLYAIKKIIVISMLKNPILYLKTCTLDSQ